MTDLLPCPFCGQIPPMSILLDDEEDDNSIVCAYVHCECGTERGERLTEEEAAKAWNTRAQPQSLSGCLHPGNEPMSCQQERRCLSASCDHYGKTEYRPRMMLEAQTPGILYPKINKGE